MSLTIQNAAAMEAVNALGPVKPLAKRMEQEHNNAMAADDSAMPPRGTEDGVREPAQDLPASDTDPAVPDQNDDRACDRVDDAQPDASNDPAEAFIERFVSGARTAEATSAMRLSPGSVPTVPTAPEKAPPAAVPPEAATPATEGDVPTAAKPGRTSNPAPPSAATPYSFGSPTKMAPFKSPPSTGAPAPGAGVQGAAQPAGAPHASTATLDRTVGKERGAALSAPAATGADAAGDSDAASVMPRAPSSETTITAGRQESNAAPLPALAAQDAATRHSADAAAGEAGQARSEANIASQRNLQHVQQALKTAEVLANRVSAGARMNVAFTSWGPGNSVSLSRQLGGHWTAIPSNARVGQALGSNTPSDLQVQPEGEHLRVEESSMTDPDGRRGQQREHDTA